MRDVQASRSEGVDTMTTTLARPVSTSAEVKRFMEDARRRMNHEFGYWLPNARRSHTFVYPSCAITIYGPGLLHNGLVDYTGDLGQFQAYIGKNIGKVF